MVNFAFLIGNICDPQNFVENLRPLELLCIISDTLQNEINEYGIKSLYVLHDFLRLFENLFKTNLCVKCRSKSVFALEFLCKMSDPQDLAQNLGPP